MSNCGRTFTCTKSIHPRWSPDGSSIAFIVQTDDQSRFLSAAVAIADASTGTVTQVYSTSDAHLAFPDWSPDGKRVVVEIDTYANHADPRPAETTLAILDVTGGTPAPIPGLPAFAGHPDWNADGSAIVFRTNPYIEGQTADQTTGTAIRTVAPDGTAGRIVLEEPRNGRVLRGTSWTPDGTGILYAAIDRGTGDSTLRIVDADGTHDRSATGETTTVGGEPRLRPHP
jgi:Tol biopolymer transport system component